MLVWRCAFGVVEKSQKWAELIKKFCDDEKLCREGAEVFMGYGVIMSNDKSW